LKSIGSISQVHEVAHYIGFRNAFNYNDAFPNIRGMVTLEAEGTISMEIYYYFYFQSLTDYS